MKHLLVAAVLIAAPLVNPVVHTDVAHDEGFFVNAKRTLPVPKIAEHLLGIAGEMAVIGFTQLLCAGGKLAS